MTEKELQDYLDQAFYQKVVLHVNDNRRNIITCQQKGFTIMVVRVHKMFLDASPKVLRSLAGFCKRPTKSNRSVINSFIKDNQDQIRESEKKKLAQEKCITKGKYHDLEELFKKLNLKYFLGKCTSAYTWGRDIKPRKGQRTIFLGNYNYETNTIRIHPALDRKSIPLYLVETTLYHEMLHWYIPPKRTDSRIIFHSKLFRQAEKAHPLYESAQVWKNKNIHLLLGRSRRLK